LPIVVGGTHQYIEALCFKNALLSEIINDLNNNNNNENNDNNDNNEEMKQENGKEEQTNLNTNINAKQTQISKEEAILNYEKLKSLDPNTAAKLHFNNTR